MVVSHGYCKFKCNGNVITIVYLYKTICYMTSSQRTYDPQITTTPSALLLTVTIERVPDFQLHQHRQSSRSPSTWMLFFLSSLKLKTNDTCWNIIHSNSLNVIRLRWDILSIVWSAVSIHTHSRSIFNKRIKIRNETYMFHGSFILNQLVQQAFKNNYHIIKFFSCNYTDLSRILRSIWPTNLSKLDLENTLQKTKHQL